MAERLNASVGATDTVAGLGGDEFAIIQTAIRSPDDAAILAQRVIESIGRPFDIQSQQIRIGASIGIAMAPDDGLEADDLLVKADAALYRSKKGGRNRFGFHAD